MTDKEDTNVKLARIEVHLSTLAHEVAQVLGMVQGKDGKPGMIVRLDRLEQSESRRTKLVWICVGVASAALIKSFAAIVGVNAAG